MGNQQLEITVGEGDVTSRQPDERGQAVLRTQWKEDRIMGSLFLTRGPQG